MLPSEGCLLSWQMEMVLLIIIAPLMPARREPFSQYWSAVAPVRFVMASLVAVALALVCGLKAQVSVVLLFMVNDSFLAERRRYNATGDDLCPHPPEDSFAEGPFAWSHTTCGAVLAAYFMGSLLSQPPWTYVARRVNPKWLLLSVLLFNMVLSVALPYAAMFGGWIAFAALRGLQGFISGGTFTTAYAVLAAWTPPEERDTVVAILSTGAALGTVAATHLSAWAAAALSWRWSFLLAAVACVPWCGFWAIYAAREPRRSPYISGSERAFIAAALAAAIVPEEGAKFPWRPAMSSLRFWAILIAHFCHNCGWCFVQTLMPTFMKYALYTHERQAARLCAASYFAMWVVTLGLAYLLLRAYLKGSLSECFAKRILCGINSLVPGACLLGIAFLGCDTRASLCLATVAVTFIGALSFGVVANPMHLAPNFGGPLISIVNFVAAIPGTFLPFVVGIIIEDSAKLLNWIPLLYALFGLYVLMFLAFGLGGTCEEQWWNNPRDDKTS